MVLEKDDKPFVVGMALKAEKAKKHISKKLTDYAEKHGIQLKLIDAKLPLDSQGHLDAICHKIRRRGNNNGNKTKIHIASMQFW